MKVFIRLALALAAFAALTISASPAGAIGGKGEFGCTLTIGYWKNHEEAMGPLLPVRLGADGRPDTVWVTDIWQADDILNIPVASNGIYKLQAQLLAAKLNVANGASIRGVARTARRDADRLLGRYNPGEWDALSTELKSKINAVMSTLDDYNNGIIGPGHCPS